VDGWNRRNPRLAITPTSRQIKLDGEDAAEDMAGEHRTGDGLLQQLNRCRALMLPLSAWPAAVTEFSAKWSQYKNANGLLDFWDLIEVSLRDVPVAPHSPRVIVADEAQDLTPMLAKLVRKCGAHTDHFVLAGDDDQLVYSWTGATPEVLLEPSIPNNHVIFLEESYRVPRAVHHVADKMIRQVNRRLDKKYEPRPAAGMVHRLSQGGYRSPEYWILKTAEQHINQGKSILFLASCSYMLRPIIAVLRKNGIPFHNPYRKANGFWNQLRLTSRACAARRVLSLLGAHPGWGGEQRPWTYGELLSWTEWLPKDRVLRPAASERLRSAHANLSVPSSVLAEVFEKGALDSLLEAQNRGYADLLHWWRLGVCGEFRKRTAFPCDVAVRRGPNGLVEEPSVVVGTIHSVKGAQADVVYLLPDLSKAGDAQYHRLGPEIDAVLHVFYVGMTRARETLYICSGESPMAMRI
jgi:superfamily I DNA/RNA helicase